VILKRLSIPNRQSYRAKVANSAAKQDLVLITASERLVNFYFELVTKATKGWKMQQIVAIIVRG